MRDILSLVLLASAAAVASAATTGSVPSRLECLRTQYVSLADASTCGDLGELAYCFSALGKKSTISVPADTLLSALEQCFVTAGCMAPEAASQVLATLRRCDASIPIPDLRRRAYPPPPLAVDIAARAANALPEVTVAPAPGAAADVLFARQIGAVCLTEQRIQTTTCPLITEGPDKGRKGECTSTELTSSVCREGKICVVSQDSSISCMDRQGTPPTEGIVIAVVFAVLIVAAVFSVCFMCCRERRTHRRLERAAEAARIAREAKTQAAVAAKKVVVSPGGAAGGQGAGMEGQPLMYQSGNGYGGDAGYFSQTAPGGGQGQGQLGGAGSPATPGGYGAPNPFADAPADSHPLR